MLVNLVGLFGRSWQDMKEAALEDFPVKVSVSFNGGIGIEILDVCKTLARSKSSIKGYVYL